MFLTLAALNDVPVSFTHVAMYCLPVTLTFVAMNLQFIATRVIGDMGTFPMSPFTRVAINCVPVFL